MMRADEVIDLFPSPQGMIYGAQLEIFQVDFIKFFFMGAISTFDTTIDFWRMGREQEQMQVAILAGLFEGGVVQEEAKGLFFILKIGQSMSTTVKKG
jgi:hypothetical protein